MNDEIKELRANQMQLTALIAQLNAHVDALKAECARQKVWIEKLGARQKLEWSQDANDWRDKAKLDELRKNG